MDEELRDCRASFQEELAEYGENGPPRDILDDEILAAYTLERPAGSFALPARLGVEEALRVSSLFERWFEAEAVVVYYNEDSKKTSSIPLEEYEKLDEGTPLSHFHVFYSRLSGLVEVLAHREIEHCGEKNDALRGVLFGYDLDEVENFCSR